MKSLHIHLVIFSIKNFIPMKKLESKFIEINTDEVIEFLNKPITSFTKKDLSSPEISFYDDNEIEAGCYDFEIDGLSFQRCWIEPVERDENGRYKYRSGSYYVIKNSNKHLNVKHC